MQRHCGCALLFRDTTGIKVSVVRVVDADAELDRHRDRGSLSGAHCCGDDLAKKLSFVGQGRSTAATGHLGYRAAEVQIDVIGQVLLDDHLRGAVGGCRIHGVEL